MAKRRKALAIVVGFSVAALYSLSYSGLFSKSLMSFPILELGSAVLDMTIADHAANLTGISSDAPYVASSQDSLKRITILEKTAADIINDTSRLESFGGSTSSNSNKDAPVVSTNLSAFDQNSPTTVVLYSKARTDQSGMAIQDMLKAHAYAFKTNRTYGGACAREPSDKLRGRISEEGKLLASLGLQNVIKFACPPFEGNSTEETGTVHHIMDASEYLFSSKHLFTSSWTTTIKSHMAKSSSLPSGRQPRPDHQPLQVAVHVRRGDVDPCETYFTGKDFRKVSRYLPNSYYQLVLERYLFGNVNSNISMLAANSNVELSVYSVRKSYESWNNWTLWYNMTRKKQLSQTDQVSSPRLSKFSLKLDESLEKTWLALRTADILVMSKSAFSFVPAILNFRGRIIYYPFFSSPLSHWTVVDKEIQNFTTRAIESMQHAMNC